MVYKQDNNITQRFVGYQAYKLTLFRNFPKKRMVGQGYKFEKNNRNFNTNDPDGNYICLEFNF